MSFIPQPKLGLVIPCFNEAAVLNQTTKELLSLFDDMSMAGLIHPDSRIYYVDDGSSDATWSQIVAFAESDQRVKGIKLSANRGHQMALMAGLWNADGDVLISMDADLQDDLSAVRDMLIAYQNGKDIVYGVRNDRGTDSWMKKHSAELYYRLLKLLGVDIVFNHADFRLMSRRAIAALKAYPESNLFLRGVIPTIGFPTAIVTYARKARFAGTSKYPMQKMLALAVDGITSFSAVPLRMIALLGLLVFVGSLALSLWVLWVKLFTNQAIPGWASSVLPMYFLGGVQLLSIGVLGEYVAKTYIETKKRPRFFIEDEV